MNVNLIEGVHEKTADGLKAILYAQAKVRLLVAIPVIAINIVLFFTMHGGVPFWFLALTAGYCLYAASPFLAIPRASYTALQYLLIGSAVSDPMVLTIWMALTGKFGSVIVGFYLFTILGFGFRTGRPLMHLCQLVAVLGFILILVTDAYWQQNPVVWMALMLPLLVVPMYAGALIKHLRLAREHAEQQSRAKSELLAKVSHELRTPLTGIVAAAELLAAESSDRAVARRTETILTLSENLLAEINDLLDEAKFEAGVPVLKKAPVELATQLQPLCATFESMAVKKGLAFRATIDPAITDAVETDMHLLRRVLLNLVGNAIKFTEQGKVELAVELVDQSADSYRLRFSVSDTGIGIPEEFKDKLFQPFAQVEQGASRRYGGTGLGLALSKKIVEAMGGDLRCESRLGAGSRFWFEIALAHVKPAASAPAAKMPAAIVPAKRILVAEDNLTNLVLLQELLKIDHHDVTTCTSGMAALDLLAKHDFDLLVLDYNLGDMDGIRVLQTYHFGRLNPAPALFLTADATAQTTAQLKAAGAAGVLHKPVNLSALRAGLARVFLAPAEGETEPAAERAEAAKSERPALKVVPIDPLDHDIIEELRSVNNQPGFLATLLLHAENDIARSCELLIKALADRSYATIPNVAHALKGVSANVGAIRLAKLAHGLMNLPSEEIDAARDRLAADLREWSKATIQALREIIAQANAASAGDTGSLHLD
jgi:two-component system sensor histidine kinase RpfC